MHRLNLPAVRSALCCALVLIFALAHAAATLARKGSTVSGVVRDSSGAGVGEAAVSLLTAQQATVASTKTNSQGRFALSDIPAGHYLLVVASRGFQRNQMAVSVRQDRVDV